MNTCDRMAELGLFALDAMGPEDRARVEAHLLECDDCRAEHALLAELPGILGQVDAADVDAYFEEDDSSADEDYVVSLAAARVQRTRRRWLIAAAAAAVVVLVTGPILAIMLTSSDPGAEHSDTSHIAAPPSIPNPVRSATVVDPGTRTSLSYALEGRKWGTHVVFDLAGVSGVKQCKLVAVSKTGQRMDTATWIVPAPGYGVPGQPNPLQLHAAIAINLDQLAALEVETMQGERLVQASV